MNCNPALTTEDTEDAEENQKRGKTNVDRSKMTVRNPLPQISIWLEHLLIMGVYTPLLFLLVPFLRVLRVLRGEMFKLVL